MKTVTLSDDAALKVSAFADADYTEKVKANICDALCTLIADADQNYTTPKMSVLVMLQDYAELITALSEPSGIE